MNNRKISHALGKGSLNHNNRNYIYENVDPRRSLLLKFQMNMKKDFRSVTQTFMFLILYLHIDYVPSEKQKNTAEINSKEQINKTKSLYLQQSSRDYFYTLKQEKLLRAAENYDITYLKNKTVEALIGRSNIYEYRIIY